MINTELSNKHVGYSSSLGLLLKKTNKIWSKTVGKSVCHFIIGKDTHVTKVTSRNSFIYMVYEEHQGEIHNYKFLWFPFAGNEDLCFWLKNIPRISNSYNPLEKGWMEMWNHFHPFGSPDQVTFTQMLVWGITKKKKVLYSNGFHNIKNRKRLGPGSLLLLFIWSLALPS